jgi:hypothetical protein
MNTSQLILKSKRKLCGAVAASLLIGISQTHATQTVRELFDNLAGATVGDGTTIDGMTNGATTVGLQGAWLNHPPGGTGIGYKGSWSLDWVMQGLDGTTLPHKAGINGQNGLLNRYEGNLNTLTNPATSEPYGTLSPQIYATHPLSPSAYADCSANGTYWFSVRIEKNYSWAAGDSSAGLGLSTGGNLTNRFVGFGVTRPGTKAADDVTDWGDTDYVTYGTLGQAGLSALQPDTGGPYLPLAVGAAQLWNSGLGAVNWAEAGLLVGRLTTTAGGNCTLDVVTFLPNATLVIDPGSIVWDATTSFTETNVMTHLLVWMHGPNVEYDALRIGTTYADVIGLELIGKPKATPSSTEYAGTTVTVSQDAAVNSGLTPMSYQWLSNNVAIDPIAEPSAATASLLLTNTTTAFTADYSVIVSNYYGMLTSSVTHVTFLPTTPPFFYDKPVHATRYLGATEASFWCSADGTPPFTYQWQHAGTNYGLPVVTSDKTNKLVLPAPLTLAEAGEYSVTVANNYGSTNSGNVTLTVIQPAPGTFAAAVTANSPWGYWRLDNVTQANPTLVDQWGNNNGVVLDVSRPTYQAPAAPYVGFPNPHLGLGIINDGNNACRVNLPKLPIWTNNMTIVAWVNNGGFQMVPMNFYGNGYGLEIKNDANNSLTNRIWFHWATLGAPSASGGLDTGLDMPAAGWAFVALAIQPDQVTVYVGNDNSNLVSATLSGLALPTSDDAGDTAGMPPIGLGRMQWPYSEDGAGAPWNTRSATWSDVAIFFHTLEPAAITNLYLTGVGQAVYATPNGANLDLKWNPAFILQQADSVTGPWTDVGGSPASPFSAPINPALPQRYYKARQ